MQNTTTHAVLVRIIVDRYEDTGEGFMTAKQALATSREYLDSLIASPAREDRKDGTVDHSLAGKADRFDVVAQSVEDNGEENDGDDIGRWTCSFTIIARFVVQAASRKAAEQDVMADIEATIGDVMCDSVEEWACNFSSEFVRS